MQELTKYPVTNRVAPITTQQLQKIMKSFVDYPPRAVQSDSYAGPMSITRFRTIQDSETADEAKADSIAGAK